MKQAMLALLIGIALPSPAWAQAAPTHAPLAGTRLDIVGTGEVSRVPDQARISAGVMTQAQSANDALRRNAERMQAVRAALRQAGIADRDIQTSAINLHPEYRYQENQPPQLVGYRASNQVTVRFRDLANAGRILDALVAQGANQIAGPSLGLSDPDEAMNAARQEALTDARARAEIYARALGMRVRRIVSVSETGGFAVPPPQPYAAMAREMAVADTRIEPGEQEIRATLHVTFELE
jgi:uncharacterized protein